MSFHVGQKVVCVEDGNFGQPGMGWGRGEEIRRGHVYTIAHIFTDDDGDTLFELEEVKRCALTHILWGHGGYWSRRFRPAKTTSIEIFSAMLVNPPREIVGA